MYCPECGSKLETDPEICLACQEWENLKEATVVDPEGLIGPPGATYRIIEEE